MVTALAALSGPDGTVRVASAANDGTVRVSPPFSGPDDTPPERLPDLGQPPRTRARGAGTHALLRTRSGQVGGVWLADTERAQPAYIDALLVSEGVAPLLFLSTGYRIESNTRDDRGGVLVIFDV
jgi:hypothetical protein